MSKPIREEEKILQELQGSLLGVTQTLANPGIFNLIKDLLNQQLLSLNARNEQMQLASGAKISPKSAAIEPESPADDLPKRPKLG